MENMDKYEFNGFPQEPEAQEESQPEVQEEIQAEAQPVTVEESVQEDPVIETPGEASRPVSPFADSPYVIQHPQQPPEQPKYVPARPRRKTGKTILCAILIIALVAAGCGVTALTMDSYWQQREQQHLDAMGKLEEKLEDLQEQIKDNSYTGSGNSVSGTPNTSSDGMTPAQVYAQNIKAVVAIRSSITTNNFGQISESVSSGSGFIISADGYVVTNYHVIDQATTVRVYTYDGIEYVAAVVGYDSTNDVALLKVEAADLNAVEIGSSEDLIVGDQVAAIGYPLGEMAAVLTVGYVSAKDRDITTESTIINMIQTDAAINSGNSGGPLFNMKGEVIGITTAKYSGTSSSGASIEGIGFAIPMDDVIGKLEDLKNFGYITGAYLGVMVQELDADMMDYLGLPMGAYVKEVTPGYCAERAGMKAKDIIVAIGEYRVESINDLSRALRHFKAGDATTVTVYRGGREVILDIVLDERPQQ